MPKYLLAAESPRRSTKTALIQRRQPSQQRAQQTVHAFYKATQHLLGNKGEKGLTVSKVADWAGVSIGAFYQYFTNKEALILTMAEHGRQLAFKQLDTYLTKLEADPHAATADPRLIVRNGIRVIVMGFGQGKSSQAEDAFSRTLIRLAWTWAPNDAQDIQRVLTKMSDRLMLFFELIAHPQLPAPNSAQMFVMVRSVLGILRYASLEKSHLLGSTTLEDGLTQMIFGMFDRHTLHPPADTRTAHGSALGCKLPVHSHTPPAHADVKADSEGSLRRKPVQKRSETTIQTILKAAMDLLDKKDGGQLSTEKIAARSGFSIGTVYQYFSGVDSLMRTMALHGQNLLIDKLNRQLSDIESDPRSTQVPAHLLVKDVVMLCANALCQGGVMPGGKILGKHINRLWWASENVPDYSLAAQRISARVGACITQLQHPNLPPASDATLYMVTRALMGVTRSASLERSHLLAHSTFHDALTQMAMGMLAQPTASVAPAVRR